MFAFVSLTNEMIVVWIKEGISVCVTVSLEPFIPSIPHLVGAFLGGKMSAVSNLVQLWNFEYTNWIRVRGRGRVALQSYADWLQYVREGEETKCETSQRNVLYKERKVDRENRASRTHSDSMPRQKVWQDFYQISSKWVCRRHSGTWLGIGHPLFWKYLEPNIPWL